MSLRPQLRIVNADGTMGEILPDAKNISYLDDEVDVGAVTFEYPRGGRNEDALVPLQELALFVDGKEVPNSRIRIDEYNSNRVSDSLLNVKWGAQTLLGRLDEGLILGQDDEHQREDQTTPAELRALTREKREWMEHQISRASREAKAKAKSYAESQAKKRQGNAHNSSGANAHIDGKVSPLRRRALNWAAGQAASPSQNWYHLCQSFVRQCYGFPGVYGTAYAAWLGGTKRTGTPYGDIPAGVPIYFGPNHVVLGAGGGMCYSTDYCGNGTVCYTAISNMTSSWGLSYLGWSTTVSGRTVYP